MSSLPNVSEKKRIVFSGNEAIARGAFEASVKLAAAYPGTPSTEILENLSQYPGVYTEWSPNEKVALEVAAGASYAGARSLAAMKHVGVNVAADPLFTLSYTGVRGGLVLISADDPELHSSQNEQDNRHYARHAKVPMLEPSDSEEARDFVKLAFRISEEFDTPVLVRTTTRVSHSKSVVTLEEPEHVDDQTGIEKNPTKLVMLPANARRRHYIVEQRMRDLAQRAETLHINRVETGDSRLGIITSGISSQYAREAFPSVSFLKLPANLLRQFAGSVERVMVVEELDPFLEEQVKALGIPVEGKEYIPTCGELNIEKVQRGIWTALGTPLLEMNANPLEGLPARPPNMCPGCPHRGIFYVLRKLKLFVAGDIGCYTLGFLPPLSALDTCLCMGASIGHAMGMSKVLSEADQGKVVAVIGDSTFYHSGMTGLLDVAYNKGTATVIILDNGITAMTGSQENPGTGFTLSGGPTVQVDLEGLARAMGIRRVRIVNPYRISETEQAIKEEISTLEPSLVVSKAPCVLLKRHRVLSGKPLRVDEETCLGCKQCLTTGCPALEWRAEEGLTADGKKRKGRSYINPLLCVGCDVCAQICPVAAIREPSDATPG